MDFEVEARRDVERTLREGGEAFERGIARGRLGLFGALTAFMAVLAGLFLAGVIDPGGEGIWARIGPVVLFGSGLVYAVAVWRWVSRRSPGPTFTAAVTFGDVLVVLTTVVILRRVMSRPGGPAEPLPARFDMYGLAPILILAVYLGSLRIERRLRLPLAVFASAAYLLVIRLDVGRFEVPQLLAATLIAVGAALGSKTADRIAELLDRHSRLSVLRSYLPAAFAERVASETLDLGAAVRPQALEVTLLVSDIRDFTAASEKLAPAEVVALLGEYHASMLEAVEASGGVVDKFIGDGMLVIFGLAAPGAVPPADAGAAAAVRCAAEMLERLARLNAARAASGRTPLRIGVGLHTGAVIAGTIGAGRRREFTVIGDAVNTASRIEGLTKEAHVPVLLSAATAGRLEAAAWPLRELAPMPVKGKSEPLRIYALEARPAAAG
ncbi:MAG TPA: adenylate/guanylate cyclase domain-containing protein [Myxococcales bacterium]|nr:adenylate/guanylate cyclase domain-containing protein [Myxococcales bacterium]